MNRMLIFSVHLKGTKESDIGCALVKREREREWISRSHPRIVGLTTNPVYCKTNSLSQFFKFKFFVTEKMHKQEHILFI